MTMNPFEAGLDQNPANYVPLSPVSFPSRAASAFADKVAMIDGERRFSYRQLLERCVRLASALAKLGVGRLDTIAIIASNIPEMIEAHFAVPMLGAVLNPLNTRLDAASVAFSLQHGGTKILIVDGEYAPLVRQALKEMDHPIVVIDIETPTVRRLRWGPTPMRRCWRRPTRHSVGRGLKTNGSRCVCFTPPARRQIRRAWSTAIAEPISRRWATASALASVLTASTFGRCRCSIAVVGPTPGLRSPPAGPRSVCAK
jgi:acyl-CoA synthetase (AMP-forming)/AMP-acid ligase II